MAIVAIFLGASTLNLIPVDEQLPGLRWNLRRALHATHVALGILMIVLPSISAILLVKHIDALFLTETAAVEVIAVCWLVKTFEFRKSGAETRALAGTLNGHADAAEPVDEVWQSSCDAARHRAARTGAQTE